jgi:hypothetical protein
MPHPRDPYNSRFPLRPFDVKLAQRIFRVTSGRSLRITSVNNQTEIKIMKDQDSATMIITFLLLLPWLGRAAISAMAAWREHAETQRNKARENL